MKTREVPDVSLTVQHVLHAAEALRGVAVRTPILTSAALNEELGREVWVKAESQQLTGSFKLRGAYNALAALSPADRKRGVICASSGNHALALTVAARRFDVPAAVVVPEDLPAVKRRAILSHGARIVPYARLTGRRDALVHQLAHQHGLTIIPSANDERVIAGAGTVAWEMLQEVCGLATLLASVGGGGLAAGTALAASGHDPALRVFGVEPAAADDTHRSLRVGRRISIPPPFTVADGLGHSEPARIPFEINQRLLAGVLTVSEPAISEAMAYLFRHFGLVVEPSGAVAFAGLIQALDDLPDGPVGVIVSGGNVDWNTYKALLDIAMARMEASHHAAAVLH
ncbi:threonine dehydratase [Streptomyces sp. 3330]|uniref:threonine ammonia-lyase n=1 Tax=Streptomyces sp. 3330 TaxID=2817755 RepID=UPI002860632C|nr:threonine/serine dehydratase [Streptomyces sp. 3330]MDR6980817.1 threonine dehydratase [Streptomyces sp. 3330]